MSEYIRASDGNGEAVRAVVVVNREVGDMLLNVDSVLNWPHKGIATSGDVGSDGIIDEETVTVFYYTLSGSMIHIDGFAPGYYDQGHTVEQMVLIKPTTPWADAVAEAAEQPSLPAGGTAGQLLTKISSVDGDAEWEDAPEAAGNSIVPKEVPTGAVNGSNTTFTTSQPYIGGSLQVYINGLAQSFEVTETTPTTGSFTISPAPLTGDDLVASYMFGAVGTMAADTLDGYHASAASQPNTIPVLNSEGDLDIDGDIYSSGGKVPVYNEEGKLPSSNVDFATYYADIIRFKANRSSNLNTSAGSWSLLGCNSVEYNVGGGYSNTGNQTLFTAPLKGLYTFSVSVYLGSGSSVTHGAIRVVSSNQGAQVLQNIQTDTSRRLYNLSGTTDLELDAGDTVSASAYSNVAVNINRPTETWFSGRLLIPLS